MPSMPHTLRCPRFVAQGKQPLVVQGHVEGEGVVYLGGGRCVIAPVCVGQSHVFRQQAEQTEDLVPLVRGLPSTRFHSREDRLRVQLGAVEPGARSCNARS
jgi:hypothetical protein